MADRHKAMAPFESSAISGAGRGEITPAVLREISFVSRKLLNADDFSAKLTF